MKLKRLTAALLFSLASLSCDQQPKVEAAPAAPQAGHDSHGHDGHSHEGHGHAQAAGATPGAVPLAHVEGVNTDPSIEVPPQYAAWPHINLEEAKRLLAMKGVVFADARSKVEWDQSHIPGALPVPLNEFDKYYDLNKGKFQSAKVIVAYCHGVGCHLSDRACMMFQGKGHKNVVNFYAGWPAWSEAKLPTEQ
jgi:rhodanese-related sulfurtransferase